MLCYIQDVTLEKFKELKDLAITKSILFPATFFFFFDKSSQWYLLK